MKTNVMCLNQEFNVNPDKKKVFCKLTYGIDLSTIPGIETLAYNDEFREYINDLTNKYTGIGIVYFDPEDESDYGIYISCVGGLASCSNNDIFDVELGKKIASTRAQENAFKDAKEFYEDIQSIVNNMFGDLKTLINGTSNSIKSCKNHVYDLTNYHPNYK